LSSFSSPATTLKLATRAIAANMHIHFFIVLSSYKFS